MQKTSIFSILSFFLCDTTNLLLLLLFTNLVLCLSKFKCLFKTFPCLLCNVLPSYNKTSRVTFSIVFLTLWLFSFTFSRLKLALIQFYFLKSKEALPIDFTPWFKQHAFVKLNYPISINTVNTFFSVVLGTIVANASWRPATLFVKLCRTSWPSTCPTPERFPPISSTTPSS